jgi:hypothetical protein
MNQKTILNLVAALLLLLPAGAWADDEHTPQNPPDPYAYFRVTVTASPSEAGYTSGGGMFYEGQQVSVSTSLRSADYTFSHWTLNGVAIDQPQQFTYTMEAQKLNFVAVYDFTPLNPSEPTMPDDYRLYVNTNEEGSCTFNVTNGARHKADNYVQVAAQNVSPGYQFLGWYEGGQKLSDNLSFNYLMPYEDATLTARFVYDPVSPDDPFSPDGQTSIDNHKLGDVNGDGVVNISDAVLLINHYLNGTTDELPASAADANKDGQVNVSDAVEIVNRYLNNL